MLATIGRQTILVACLTQSVALHATALAFSPNNGMQRTTLRNAADAERYAHMRIQTLLLSMIFILLTGCVSIDSRALKETADPNSIALISGKFLNQAMYRSTGEFLAIDNLAQLLSVPSRQSSEVTISFDKNTGLILQFSDSNETKIVTFEGGLTLSSDGKFELPSNSHCSFSDGTLGCQGKSITLFVNEFGNLVTIQSGGGGGLFGPFPIGVYAKHTAIFRRLN